jgi:hypothetical protein
MPQAEPPVLHRPVVKQNFTERFISPPNCAMSPSFPILDRNANLAAGHAF